MKNNIDLTKIDKEEFIYFLFYDINNYLLNELVPAFRQKQDLQKLSATLDIVRANADLYSLFHPYDLSKAPPPEPLPSTFYFPCCSN